MRMPCGRYNFFYYNREAVLDQNQCLNRPNLLKSMSYMAATDTIRSPYLTADPLTTYGWLFCSATEGKRPNLNDNQETLACKKQGEKRG
jgi:hypothetical protein